MGKRVHNFGAGPATLPQVVLEKIQKEFLDFQGLGASIIEISHRSEEFLALQKEASQLIRELFQLPDEFSILYAHGGARMQFSAIPLNFVRESRPGGYVVSGSFAKMALSEACRISKGLCLCSGEASGFKELPSLPPLVSPLSYVHMTANNTVEGTQWSQFPALGETPLIVDATSDMLSRRLPFEKIGMVYGGFQKNLGPSGMALIIVRTALLGHAAKETPLLLDYQELEKSNSLTNTTNTFAIYVLKLVLDWIKGQGGLESIEKINQAKAKIIYDFLDECPFYEGIAHPKDRSLMNVTFRLKDRGREAEFLQKALDRGLYALAGHRSVGGMRASLYNAMTLEGVKALRDFMADFSKSR